jgi:site-specific DNA recombinase
MKKAVLYARYSSDNQRSESIDAQVRAILEYASRNGYQITEQYIDEAQTATNDDRENFQRMIRDSKGADWKFVIVHKLDRFARNKYDSAINKRELKQYGIRVISVQEHLDDSPESIILESVLEGMAEYYSKNLSREVIKGPRECPSREAHRGIPAHRIRPRR